MVGGVVMGREFLIFSAGEYPQGDYRNIEVLQRFVERFNGNKQRLACFVGHKNPWEVRTDSDEFSHGEVNQLRINQRGDIYATEYELDDFLKEAIATGKLLCVSPEIYGDPQKEIDIFGLAFLGRTPSQNPFAVLPAMFGKSELGSCVGSFGIRKLKAIFRKREEDTEMTDEEKKAFAKMQERLDVIEKENTDLKKQSADFSAKLSATVTSDADKERIAFFGKARDEGKITPAEYDSMMKIDASLADNETARKAFREMIDGKKKVEMGHTVTGEGATESSPDNFSVGEIKRFQRENNIASFEEAAKLFSKKVEGK